MPQTQTDKSSDRAIHLQILHNSWKTFKAILNHMHLYKHYSGKIKETYTDVVVCLLAFGCTVRQWFTHFYHWNINAVDSIKSKMKQLFFSFFIQLICDGLYKNSLGKKTNSIPSKPFPVCSSTSCLYSTRANNAFLSEALNKSREG